MKKVLVFQHVAHKILGTLNPTLKGRGLNMRYINFDRNPSEQPSIQKYNGLIVLGGHMGVYEADKYQHIKLELKLIEEALKKDIPILGICLGAQLIAQVLGSEVKKHTSKEIGWYDIKLTNNGQNDSLLYHFNRQEKLFQLHGDTFEIPKSAIHLAYTDSCKSQAFKYRDKTYGFQFHLEVDEAMILRWLSYDFNLNEIKKSNGILTVDKIIQDTQTHIHRSVELSVQTFNHFVDLFAIKKKSIALQSDHATPTSKLTIT
jgi:GMP synthase (glutamine-hydrolysing)